MDAHNRLIHEQREAFMDVVLADAALRVGKFSIHPFNDKFATYVGRHYVRIDDTLQEAVDRIVDDIREATREIAFHPDPLI